MVDTIDPDTFEYEASGVVRGGFNWGLHFSWEGLPSSIKVRFSKAVKISG